MGVGGQEPEGNWRDSSEGTKTCLGGGRKRQRWKDSKALIHLIARDQTQLTDPFIRSLFSPASHLSIKVLHLGKEGRQAGSGNWFHNDPCRRLETAFWAWAQDQHCMVNTCAWEGAVGFYAAHVCAQLKGTDSCHCITGNIPVVACTAIGHRRPQSSFSLILVPLFGYKTTNQFCWPVKLTWPNLMAQAVVMEQMIQD